MSAVVAAILLLIGGLSAIPTFVILVASPFMLVMICLCRALFRDLRSDPMFARPGEPATAPLGGHRPGREAEDARQPVPAGELAGTPDSASR